MVFISRIQARGFKSFKSLDITLDKNYICLAGPNGSGKCVDGDTEIYLADGTTTKIRDIVEEAMRTGSVDKIEDGYIAQYNNAASILCLDSKTLKVIRKPVMAFVKRKAPNKMFKINTSSGKEIIATEYHPLFILENGKILPIRADQLKKNARIAIPRKLPIDVKNTLFLELIDLIDLADNIYVPYNEKAAQTIYNKKMDNTWLQFADSIGIPERNLTSFISSKQSILFPYLVRSLRYCGLSDLEIAEIITHVQSEGGETLKMTWENSNEFCRFFGYLLAEGSVSIANNQLRFTNGSEEVVSDFINITKKLFDLNAHSHRYKDGAYDIIINSVPLRNLLVKLGMHYLGSGDKYVSEIVLKHSTDEHISNLLSGIYSGDGYVSKSSIEITLKSEKLIDTIEILLLRLGIVARRTRVEKRETRTNCLGSYIKLTIFGTENFVIFNKNVRLVHEMKRTRLDSLLNKAINPNADLLEVNGVIKKAVQDLEINVKKTKKEFPRLDAYCYNQCLPSTYGVKYLLTDLLKPISITKMKESEAVQTLEMLTNSDIFWDTIKKIEIANPCEKWVYDLSVSEHHNFIANGIFVHNSNVCDAIRFGLGESRLKTLRAKRVSDLIMQTGDKAEIMITLNGGKPQVVKRAIRKDGKTLYKLNGQKLSRTSLLDALMPLGIDVGGHNIIAQGEVQRIVEMNSKQRREIIDRISGISEFEDKRDEALAELAKVEQKISDANLVLKEREGLLTELEKDKEDAVRYKDLSEELHRYKGSRIFIELKHVDEEHTKASEKYLALKNDVEKIDDSVKAIDEKSAEIIKRKEQLVDEINAKGQRDSAYREIETLRANVSIDENKKADKEVNVQKLKERESAVKNEEKALLEKVGQLKSEILVVSQELSKVKSELEKKKKEQQAIQGSMGQKDKDFKAVKENLDSVEKEIEELKEKLHALQQEHSNSNVVIDLKSKEIERVEEELGGKNRDTTAGLDREVEKCRKQVEDMENQLKKNDENEKELMKVSSELEKKKFEIQERSAIVRSRSGKNINDGISFVLELRDKKIVSNIYGLVNELISFKQEHAIAIEAAVGSRLNYMVVKDMNAASNAITELKAKKAGRCTFIPLDRQVFELNEELRKLGRTQGAIGYLIDLIKFDKKYYNALNYAFSDTLVIEDIETAKKIGIGRVRMVTLEGDLLEVSGIVTGGTFKTKFFLADKKEAEKLGEELKECESKKEAVENEIIKIRGEATKNRKLKAELEVKIKGFELELKSIEEKESQNEVKKQFVENIEQEINLKKKECEKKAKEIEHLKKTLLELNEKRDMFRTEFELVSGSGNENVSELEKQINELLLNENAVKSRMDNKKAEIDLIEDRYAEVKKDREGIIAELKSQEEEIARLKAEISNKSKSLKGKEESVKAVSKELEKLFSERTKLEKEGEKLANEKGKLTYGNEKLTKELTKLEVTKATTEARLIDLKAEYANYESIKPLELAREELDEKIQNSERQIQELGNVNLKAPELYEEKKQDITEIKEKSEKLGEERKSVLRMIDEIELKKKDIFMQTFKVVNDNFRNLFVHVMRGEGILTLDKPEEIFTSGLFIKVKTNNAEKYIESMSGGEKSLLALVFIFAIQMYKPAPFYILDEAEAALDKENSKKLANLLKELAKTTQFIIVTHNDAILASADLAIGVTMTKEGSRIVGINLT